MSPDNPKVFTTAATTLVELLEERAAAPRAGYGYLQDGRTMAAELSYPDLSHQARAIAAQLQQQVPAGSRALLLYPPGLSFLVGFFGCLYAGVVAVPAPPPDSARLKRTLPRLQAILEDAEPEVVLTTATIVNELEERLKSVLPRLRWLLTDEVDTNVMTAWQAPTLHPQSLAYLQYTSGSTASPRGVMLSHLNILHNLGYIRQALAYDADSVSVTWMPYFHDYGLVEGLLQPLYCNIPSYVLSPLTILKRPLRWLEVISRYRATHTQGPNFSYEMCLQRISSDQRLDLDLSSWRVAGNGAEPVRADTLRRFSEAFAPYGFRAETFYPAYGLAEATLVVSARRPTAPPRSCVLQAAALEQHRIVPLESTTPSKASRTVVSCGEPQGVAQLRIVDPDTRQICSPDRVGEIWIAGPSVALGYWQKAEDSRATFQARLCDDPDEGPFLRTGDLGFVRGGELYITGRLKDLIIIGGVNHYPQDIEWTLQKHCSELRRDHCVAFSIERDGEEQLVIVAEPERRQADWNLLVRRIRELVASYHELSVVAIALVERGSILKTSSGKVQRRACRQAFLEARLATLATWQAQSAAAPIAAPARPKLTELQHWMCQQLANVLQLDPQEINLDAPFAEYGLDSRSGIALVATLEDWLGGAELSPTLLWQYPSVAALSAYLSESRPQAPASAATISPTPDRAEAVAIVGLACRFPGASNPQEFWDLLREGRSAVVPSPRLPGIEAGFLPAVEDFDAEFFGISASEAQTMDPQQRLLLEVAWEALENAGLPPQQLAGQRGSVFIGISAADHSFQQFSRPAAAELISAHSGTGLAFSVAANRLSYYLNLRGPSMAIDTACSSSLVAVHQACQSLHSGESNLALAGGVNLILSPYIQLALERAGMLSPSYRCKTFDADADGYVRGEGCGIVVLKRLGDAQRDGDTVLALIRASAVNQDGRSNGLTAPNPLAQQALIRQALAQAGLSANTIDYVETHGTGTRLGDPIEMSALQTVLGDGRQTTERCWVGSVKTNIGHLEAAAGIAGLIKAVLSLCHAEIPPHLHLQRLNPLLKLADTPFAIATSLQPWPRNVDEPTVRPRRAAVSSFGFGGTNAHIILEQAPGALETKPQCNDPERPVHLFTLSAQSPTALRELAGRYATSLRMRPDTRLADVCFTTAVHRAQLGERLALPATSSTELVAHLQTFCDEGAVAGALSGRAATQPPRVVFLFSGQGSQYVNMGRQLFKTEPTFRRAIEQCDELFRPFLACPLVQTLYPASDDHSLIDQTAYTQPAIFALEYALFQLFKSWGVVPEMLMGHSIGEYVAAWAADVFSLEEAVTLIGERGRLMQSLPQTGEMAIVFAGEQRVAAAIQQSAKAVSIAAVNGPTNVLISGECTAVQRTIRELEDQGVKTKRLQVSHAFHSALMDPILPAFREAAARVNYKLPQIAVFSCLTGALATEEIATPEYWVSHIRQPVRFAAAFLELQKQGPAICLEIGSQPVLSAMLIDSPSGTEINLLPTLRKNQDDWRQLLRSLASLYIHGYPVEWLHFYRNQPRRRVTLPTYPFQRKRHWLPDADAGRFQYPPEEPGRNALLGRRMSLAGTKEVRFEVETLPQFLTDHCIFGVKMVPASAFIEIALSAGRLIFESNLELTDFHVHQALVVESSLRTTIQTVLGSAESGCASFQLFSRATTVPNYEPEWTLHASGSLRTIEIDGGRAASQFSLNGEVQMCSEHAAHNFYSKLESQGWDLGPSFRGVRSLWRNKSEALGRVVLAESLSDDDHFTFHPVLLDSCFQVIGAALPDLGKNEIYVLIGVEQIKFYANPGSQLWSHARLRPINASSSNHLLADVCIFQFDGQLVAEINGIQLNRTTGAALTAALPTALKDCCYGVQWRPLPVGKNSANSMLSPTEICTRVRADAGVVVDAPVDYKSALARCDKLARDFILTAIQRMGFRLAPLRRFSTAEFAREAGVIEKYYRLLERLLTILAEDGVLRQTSSGWEVVRVPSVQDVSEQVRDLLARCPAEIAELVLLQRCASKLPEVLRGDCDALDLIFPDGDRGVATRFYRDSPVLRHMNALIRKAVVALIDQLPADQSLCVLEIGAGTGGTTSYIVPVLPQDQTEYVFTDISSAFTAVAAHEFRQYPFMHYRVLDIERDPASRAFDGEQYDLIVAANVLHATADLKRTLGNVRSLLAPGGKLLLLETTTPQRWVDLVFGLTNDWWTFKDVDLRPTHPLLSAQQWCELLDDTGFDEPQSITPDENEIGFPLRHSIILAQRPVIATDTRRKTERWIIFADRLGVGERLGKGLRSRGDHCTFVFAANRLERVGEDRYCIDPHNREDFETLWAMLNAQPETRPICGVVHLWSLDAKEAERTTTEDLKANATQSCGSTVSLVQTLVRQSSASPALWLVTHGAQPVEPMAQTPSVAQSLLWGLGKAVAAEHPELQCRLLDLDPTANTDELANDLEQLLCEPPADERLLARRSARTFFPRLVRTGRPKSTRNLLSPDGAYLITGGLGGAGRLVAQWMADSEARHLVLLGRTAGSKSDRAVIEELQGRGVDVLVLAADVSDADQLRSVFSRIESSMPPLRGIVHCAGVYQDRLLVDHQWRFFEEVFAPKVLGAWNLHSLSRELPLDFFLLFSSATSLIAGPGLSNYMAANAFLDALAHYRRSLGLPGQSINWGPWANVGMAKAVGETRQSQWSTQGIAPLDSKLAVHALQWLISHPAPQVGVMSVDWRRFNQFSTGTVTSFLREVASQDTAPPAGPSPFLATLEKAPNGQRSKLIAGHVREQVRCLLGLPSPQQIDPKSGFFQMGMDSLTTVELRNRLQKSLQLALPHTLTFKYPTVESLADYLAERMGAGGPSEDHKPKDEESTSQLISEVQHIPETELNALINEELSKLVD